MGTVASGGRMRCKVDDEVWERLDAEDEEEASNVRNITQIEGLLTLIVFGDPEGKLLSQI